MRKTVTHTYENIATVLATINVNRHQLELFCKRERQLKKGLHKTGLQAHIVRRGQNVD